jgi:hypothetical protein
MHWWWISMGISVAACLALVPVYGRRRARRARLDMIRARVEASLSELLKHDLPVTPFFSDGPKQPDGSPGTGVVVPPTSDSDSPSGSAVRCRTRVVLGDTRNLSTTLAPGWRLR